MSCSAYQLQILKEQPETGFVTGFVVLQQFRFLENTKFVHQAIEFYYGCTDKHGPIPNSIEIKRTTTTREGRPYSIRMTKETPKDAQLKRFFASFCRQCLQPFIQVLLAHTLYPSFQRSDIK